MKISVDECLKNMTGREEMDSALIEKIFDKQATLLREITSDFLKEINGSVKGKGKKRKRKEISSSSDSDDSSE